MGTVLVLSLLLGLGLAIGLFVLMLGGIASQDAKEKAGAPDKIAEAFDGSEQTVVYTASVTGPKRDQIIKAAADHGYRFVGSADSRWDSAMTFELR